MAFEQPDSSRVTVRLYGDEFHMRGESLDGYTVVRDRASGWICYALLSRSGEELISSTVPYLGGPLPTAIGHTERGRLLREIGGEAMEVCQRGLAGKNSSLELSV